MEQTREKGRRWVISSKDEMRQAVIDVVSEASRRVSIYTHDLEPGIYDDPDFLEIVKHLVLSQAYGVWPVADCRRLASLIEQDRMTHPGDCGKSKTPLVSSHRNSSLCLSAQDAAPWRVRNLQIF